MNWLADKFYSPPPDTLRLDPALRLVHRRAFWSGWKCCLWLGLMGYGAQGLVEYVLKLP